MPSLLWNHDHVNVHREHNSKWQHLHYWWLPKLSHMTLHVCIVVGLWIVCLASFSTRNGIHPFSTNHATPLMASLSLLWKSLHRVQRKLHTGRDEFCYNHPFLYFTLLLWNPLLPVFQSILLRIRVQTWNVRWYQRNAASSLCQKRLHGSQFYGLTKIRPMHKLFPHPRTQAKQHTPHTKCSWLCTVHQIVSSPSKAADSSLIIVIVEAVIHIFTHHPHYLILSHPFNFSTEHHTPSRTCIGLVIVSLQLFSPFISSPPSSFTCFSFSIEQGILLGNHLIVCHFEPSHLRFVFFRGKSEEERGDRELADRTRNVSTTITQTSFQRGTRKKQEWCSILLSIQEDDRLL